MRGRPSVPSWLCAAVACAAAACGVGCSLVTPVGDLDDQYGAGGAAGAGGVRPRAAGKVEDCAALAPDSGSWFLAPDSQVVGNYVRLTPSQNGALGALWWKAPTTFDELEVSFEFRVSPQWDGNSGVGFAFAWTDLQTPPAQNASFPGFGLPQVRGWSLAFDARTPIDPPNKPSFLLVDGSRSALANNDGVVGTIEARVIADSIGGPDFWHPVALRIRPGRAELFFRDALLMSPAVDGYAGFAGVWGFTASTTPAGQRSEFSVRNVRVFAPYGGGCVR